jgi:hypothetical protein
METTYASPAWEFAADTHLIKLQRLQNKVLRTIGNFPRRTPVREMHMAFHLPYVCDYMTKLCRQPAEVILNHGNENIRYIGQGEARHRKYKRHNFGGGQAYDRSSDYTTVVAEATRNKGIICCTEPGLTETLYILYIHLLPCITCKIKNIYYIMTNDLLLPTMTLTKTDPSSRQIGRPTKTRSWLSKNSSTPRQTDLLTDRQSQCDFGFD